MTDSHNVNESDLHNFEIIDPFGFDSNATIESQSLISFTFVILTALCVFMNTLCLWYLIKSRKYRLNATYNVLSHYFFFKVLFAVTLCITLLMSNFFEKSAFYIRPSNFLCKLEFFSTMFMETGENYLIMFIWLTLLSERSLIGFSLLNNEENMVENPSVKNWLRKHSRTIFLVNFIAKKFLTFKTLNFNIQIFKVSFYTITFLLTAFFALDVEFYNIGIFYNSGEKSHLVCATKSFISLPIIFIANYPLIFWFMLFGTLFWKLFGGSRDPILHKLDESDLKLLKFIKIASLLRALEVIVVHTQITLLQMFMKINLHVVEFSRTSGFVIVLVTAGLFIYYEGILIRLWESRKNPFSRQNNETMERNRAEDQAVVYANLIE